MTLRRPTHASAARLVRLAARARQLGGEFAARLGAVCTAAAIAATMTPAAFADPASPSPTASSTASSTSSESSTSSASAGAGGSAGASASCVNAVCITADELTPVVTSTSGYHIAVTITNATSAAIDQATLTVATNPLYTFTSRVDMQDWADSAASIPTRTTLGSTQVAGLASGASTQARVDVTPDNAGLAAITTWGPKPLRISLSASAASQGTTSQSTASQSAATLNTFLTRSTDGVRSADTPPLNITVAMPLTAGTWQVNDEFAKALSSSPSSARTATSGAAGASGTASPSGSSTAPAQPSASGSSADSGSDAASASSSASSASSSASASPSAAPSAGANASADAAATAVEDSAASGIAVTDSQQRVAQTALINRHPELQVIADPLYLSTFDDAPRTAAKAQPGFFDIDATGSQPSEALAEAGINASDWKATDADSIAWQGQGAWTMSALEAAAAQGYRTVIAGPDFEASSTAAAHTGSYVVSTAAGDVTVLASQTSLTRLVQNQATSQNAAAESTAAGQMARFIAQSAFYQMEQPYADRILLVTFSPDSSLQRIDQMMTAMEEASWITLTDLNAMRNAAPYRTGTRAEQAVPKESGISESTTSAIASALSAAASARDAVDRFSDKVIAADGMSDTSLASLNRWMSSIKSAQHALTLRAFDASGQNLTLVGKAQALADGLFGGVSISPSDSINVVSETAQMPVTVSNNHDFPVHVRVESKTDSMQIVTSREAEATIPPHAEVQVTFTIRVLTSGSAQAHLTLLDADGESFGATHQTRISSKLQIADMSGMIIIVLAVLLGLLGLWRQFHRKKDPDE